MKKTTTRSPAERLLDQAIEFTFPASDPIAVEHAFRSARKVDQPRTADKPRRQARDAKPGRGKPARKSGV